MRTVAKSVILVSALAAILGLPGCDGHDGLNVFSFKVAVTTADGTVTAIRRNGTPPVENGGPSLTAPPAANAINGGVIQVQLTADTDATTVFISVEGVPGYFELILPEALRIIDLLVFLRQNMPFTNFRCVFSLADEGGFVGPSTFTDVTVLPVGTGDLQISLNIDVSNDIDLHVIDPNGFEIFYDQLLSPEGGRLDLDTNASCDIDGANNENISWPSGQAPSGLYTVRVDNFENCTEAAVNWVVTINRGGDIEAHTGSFAADDPGDEGAAGSGVTVTSFTLP